MIIFKRRSASTFNGRQEEEEANDKIEGGQIVE
jgi:hypothetical protein